MAHQISIRESGKAEMAYTMKTSKDVPWHGLGQVLTEDAPISTWKKEAGMDWAALESAVTMNALGEDIVIPNKKALFRSDNKLPLAIVGSEYNVVQPGEVLDFFDDLTKVNGMKLSTAGTLFEGRRFWALAETNRKADVGQGDEIGAYLLLTTSVDGTLSTQARFTSTRVVCSNTLSLALSENSKSVIKVTHKRVFDPKDVKMDLGLLDKSWSKFIENIGVLKNIKMEETATRNFFQKLFFDPSKKEEDQPLGNIRTVEALMVRAFNGIGSEMSKGTAWGALNGATEWFTHGNGNAKNDPSHQFWNSYCGNGAEQKTRVFDQLMALA